MAARKKPARPSTSDRLKSAARRLFADKGIEAVTVRDILSAAKEKNGASLNYHFGSKEDLIREIIRDQFAEMNSRWERALAEVDAQSGERTVRQLVHIIVEESIAPFVGDEVPVAARIAFAALQSRRHVVTQIFKEHRLQAHDRILMRIMELIDLPASIMRQRLIFLTHYLSALLAVHEMALVGGSIEQRAVWSKASDLGNLIDTAVGLLTAPVVDAADHGSSTTGPALSLALSGPRY
jgi:AcrR family transcriptional regulator